MNRNKKTMIGIIVTLALAVTFLGGYWTAKTRYEDRMNDVYQAMREGRSGSDAVSGVEIVPRKEGTE